VPGFQKVLEVGDFVVTAGFITSSETQGLLVGTMGYFRRAIFLTRKFISRAEEPQGTFSYQMSSRSVEIRSADWPEKYFSGQLTRRSSRVILSPFYTKWFSSSIEQEDSRRYTFDKFAKKIDGRVLRFPRLRQISFPETPHGNLPV